jgi:predicted transcriptional regulator of viral defense system
MKYEQLVKLLGKQGFFDLASVIQLMGERRESIRIQLSRLCRSGKLISLRRGMYAFPEIGTAVSINPALLANSLYSPSYLSTHWALGYYGLIPEKVAMYTSVTRRVTRSFSNGLGNFQYQTIKKEAFFGYKLLEIGRDKVLMAEPEKALLDLWYLQSGDWNEARMTEMRFQNTGTVDRSRLNDYAERYQSQRLVKAAKLWATLADKEEKGMVEL